MGYIPDFETRMRVILEGYVPEEVLKKALAAAKGRSGRELCAEVDERRRGRLPSVPYGRTLDH